MYKVTKEIEHMKLLMVLIVMSLVIKCIYYHYADITPIIERYVYKTQTNRLKQTDIDIIEQQLKESEVAYFCLGRASCIDCRSSLKNILYLEKRLLNDELIYVEVPERLSKYEKDFLSNQLQIDNIPIILSVNKDDIKYFIYDDINAVDNEKRFLDFVNDSKEENE